jgi:hypothetical protein
MPRKLRPTPVPLDTPRNAIVREVEAKFRRFVADAARSQFPEGGEDVTQNYAVMVREIAGLAGRHETICSIKGDGNVPTNDAAAVCYVGAQETILLRIIHRTGKSTWNRYEFAFCTQEHGHPTRWVNAKEYYKASVAVPDPTTSEPDMALVRSSAEALVVNIRQGTRQMRLKGAQLTGDEVQGQIKGLGAAVKFELGADATRLGLGSYKAVCFTAGSVIKLRVFRRANDGWVHGTFTLDTSKTSAGPARRARGATGGPRYRWRG